MAKSASLPFNGNFQHSQKFGVRPEAYEKFGLKGHDGDDWMMPINTPLFCPVDGKVLTTGNDADGWGIYAQVWDPIQNLLINVTHCNYINLWNNKEVKRGDKLGGSGDTGNSSAPHVHVAAADTDSSGNRLNQGNGFKGWYSIMDGNKISLQPLPIVAGATSPTGETVTMTWGQIYTKYYPGWGETEAKANFQDAFHGNLLELQIARGDVPAGATVQRPPELKKTYYLIPAFDGLTLNQINSGIPLGRPDILADFLGIDENTNLTGGQAFNLANFPSGYFPDSDEWKGFKKMVGLTPVGTPGNYFIKPEFANKSLSQIGREGTETGRTDILAGFLGLSEYYKIPPFQGIGITGFPSSYIPNSSEWQGFLRIFWQTAPTQPKAPIDNPPDAPVEAIYTELPDTGEGLTPIETPAPVETMPTDKTDLILTKLDEILAKLGTQPTTTTPDAPQADEATGGLFVISTPARAAIYVDGAFQYDYTPSNSTYRMAPGQYTVTLKKTGYKLLEKRITVESNETTNVEETLEEL